MTRDRLPDVVSCELITDEALVALRGVGQEGAHQDVKVAIASVLFADAEGVARLGDRTLARWLAGDGKTKVPMREVRQSIDRLTEGGVLAEGSTPTELYSMIGRRAEVQGENGMRSEAA
ncbi:hypothetical protein I8D64_14000 [Brachybacterium sp. MASK1Z-5]|uniref:DUF222 domain-containing protein n=1 Tax=Brachybacterium halotolerans TaxID=2795215 RepID=A0ABS1BCY0_9MICO|nr:hypothetical protein [Brachybacterium halotolerans]MBK0332509.1 hypothetical protein [Brachybacterium halotolerans]